MRLLAAGRAALQRPRPICRPLTTINNHILPECFRTLPGREDAPYTPPDAASDAAPHTISTAAPHTAPHAALREDDPGPDEEISFHLMAAGGYNGLLAKAFEYGGNPDRILAVHRSMAQAGAPMSALTYNYLIAAHLKKRQFEEAYRAVYEMERAGFPPNMMTFEILLTGLSCLRAMGVAADSLFDMMQAKYGLAPSVGCWTARAAAWTHKKSEKQAIRCYDQMAKECPAGLTSSHAHVHLLRTAIRRYCWGVAAHLLHNIRSADGGLAIVPRQCLAELWDMPALFHDARSLPVVRFISNELPLDDNTAVRLLYFAARSADAGLAEKAMTHIFKTQQSLKAATLPITHIQAYLEATAREAPTEAIRAKIGLFQAALDRTVLGPKKEI